MHSLKSIIFVLNSFKFVLLNDKIILASEFSIILSFLFIGCEVLIGIYTAPIAKVAITDATCQTLLGISIMTLSPLVIPFFSKFLKIEYTYLLNSSYVYSLLSQINAVLFLCSFNESK